MPFTHILLQYIYVARHKQNFGFYFKNEKLFQTQPPPCHSFAWIYWSNKLFTSKKTELNRNPHEPLASPTVNWVISRLLSLNDNMFKDVFDLQHLDDLSLVVTRRLVCSSNRLWVRQLTALFRQLPAFLYSQKNHLMPLFISIFRTDQ